MCESFPYRHRHQFACSTYCSSAHTVMGHMAACDADALVGQTTYTPPGSESLALLYYSQHYHLPSWSPRARLLLQVKLGSPGLSGRLPGVKRPGVIPCKVGQACKNSIPAVNQNAASTAWLPWRRLSKPQNRVAVAPGLRVVEMVVSPARTHRKPELPGCRDPRQRNCPSQHAALRWTHRDSIC